MKKKHGRKGKEGRMIHGSSDFTYITGKPQKKRENFSLHNKKLQDIINKSNKKMIDRFNHDKELSIDRMTSNNYAYKTKYSLVRVEDRPSKVIKGFKTDPNYRFGGEEEEGVELQGGNKALSGKTQLRFDAFKQHFEGLRSQDR